VSRDDHVPCKICGSSTRYIGQKTGKLIAGPFNFLRCTSCKFVSIANPSTDFEKLYDEKYYRGEGADPLVDYAAELNDPDHSIRQYEWRGISDAVRASLGDLRGRRWLDFGCGSGGLVRYTRDVEAAASVGYDTGAFTDKARAAGIPIIGDDDLSRLESAFDVVTLIEVIEHVPDPLPMLSTIARVLKPNGLLFLTTGIAPEDDAAFMRWPYAIPEIHVSFFTPESMRVALARSGMAPAAGPSAGWNDITRFKILKNLGFKKISFAEKIIPWRLAAPPITQFYGLSKHPIGRKTDVQP
jgi:SAM-dependent methyltransferase